MAEQKQRKPWQDMAFRELDNKALIEHAKSLGGKKAVEALTYLQQLDAEKIPFTAEMKQKRREELQKKKKRQKKKYGNWKRREQPPIPRILMRPRQSWKKPRKH